MRTALRFVLLWSALSVPALAQEAAEAAAPVTTASEAAAEQSTMTVMENYRRVTVTVYGDDPCPAAQSADEIVVCARRPETERFRLRTLDAPDGVAVPEGRIEQGGVGRTLGTDDVRLAGGTGSCTPVGPGGLTGCNKGINILAIGEALNSLITE
ncbi:MAG: hypothetical protein Q7J32_02910 [Sphingomonadaceae bacterium]|nr:hypothetical protein [Sphingomonadaceae bacterium]